MKTPYITKRRTEVIVERLYNPEYGDDRICRCGHHYYRHFDSYEDNAAVGCKYCGCYDFKEAPVANVNPDLAFRPVPAACDVYVTISPDDPAISYLEPRPHDPELAATREPMECKVYWQEGEGRFVARITDAIHFGQYVRLPKRFNKRLEVAIEKLQK